jgi:hypothetical protein
MAVNTLYISAVGTSSIDFRDAGNIVGINMVSNDNAPGTIEVSFNSSPSFTTNDTTGVIGGLILPGNGTGADFSAVMREAVDVGERLFLHSSSAAATRVFVYTDATGTKPSPRRR